MRTLDRLDVRRERDDIFFEASARSFLHRQVRSMVGTLIEVGAGPVLTQAPLRIDERVLAGLGFDLEAPQRRLGERLAHRALLIGPASQIYRRVDAWQDLALIARAVQRDTLDKPLVLLAPDETTRAIIDMYARPAVARIDGPFDASRIERVRSFDAASPDSLFLVQLPSQAPTLPWRTRPAQSAIPVWEAANLTVVQTYGLANGRRYALLRLRP